jgi:RHS repeat-associated protein
VIKRNVQRFVRVMGLLLICSAPAHAQVATGTPPFGSFGGGPDVINLGNLNAHITVPVLNKPGRGMPFSYNLTYDSSVLYPSTVAGTSTWTPVYNWGWSAATQASTGYVSNTSGFSQCSYMQGRIKLLGPLHTWTTNYVYHDPWGVPHPFTGTANNWTGTPGGDCTLGTDNGFTNTASDGSGYTINVVAPGGATLTARNGRIIAAPRGSGAGAASSTDTNGNQVSVNSSGVFTDTLGTTALTVAGVAPSNTTFTYTAPSGAAAAYTMKYGSYSVLTSFGCSGITEYSASSVPLVSEIDLPDGTKYVFTYEETVAGNPSPVTGRLASVQLPTGGTITYKYTGANNGIECSDGSAAGLSRSTPDGLWTYSRSGTGTAWTTTVTDPVSNQTVINFQSVLPIAGPPTQFYETERQISDSGTLLKTIFTCYNPTTPNCNSTAVVQPIAKRSVYALWAGTGGLESRIDTAYDGFGDVTEKDEYGYGVGTPGSIVRKTVTLYASLGNGIVNLPSSIIVTDGSNNVKSQTSYTYDVGGVTATAGTPQHVAISGSRGNATTISYLVGSTSLSKSFTYYDTGTVSVATDVNGATTTYTYGSGTSCGNSFVTSVAEPMSLTRLMVWNCTGGVQASGTDENGKTSTTSYTDTEFWRPFSVTDAASNVANFSYETQTSIEAAVNFGSSTTDGLKTVDGLGRTHVSQRKEGPSSSTYDSVETDYDTLGRPSRTTLPYPATAGTLNPSAPGTTTTYDALNRKKQVADSGSRSVGFTYSQNDTYRTLGPAPAGESTKRKQFEYDALGRMTSVCEITSVTGSGPCGQTTSATGYATQYTYDAMNHLIGVTQNAQSASKQTRAYAYDDLGRLTSETNPESAITTYTYDADTTCGTSKGDLVKKIDAKGNTICYAYDALHRVTSTTYAGPYSTTTPNRYFVYDAAMVNSVAMANAKTRVAEAYTSTCQTCSKITDLGFSYTVLGQPADVYELTPHSGPYYHVTNSYFANGAVNQLSNLVGLPTITYGVDAEGRVNSASASSGQNPLTAASYNPASEATGITFGSTDSDSFTYDPNTNRMTQYKFSVNGQSVTGTLTWNAISTLETLAITDPFYGPGNQTCSYTHDDVSRIASANCGSPWSQTFGYDAFGNLSKTGTVSFQPTYSYLTNQMTAIGSSSVSYDSNGNVLSDTAHTYTWDANGRPVTIDTGTSLTYDALGRMVEQDKSGVFTEIAYAPTGGKLAIMSGQTLQKAFVPLPGGAAAVYVSSGLSYYRHSDWIGSSRFASTPGRALYFDGAYAPFGENYAQTGTTDLSFTGMNQDTVANLYDFPAREYNGIHGRWPSPDPAGISSVQLRDPQTLNRYAYVRNSPLNYLDPTGMFCDTVDADEGCGEGDGGEDNGDNGNGGDGTGGDTATNADPCTGNPGLCDPGDPCLNPFAGSCSNPFGGSGPVGWGNGNVGGPDETGGGADPCVYSNDDGSYSVDTNSSPSECGQKNADGTVDGTWVPDNGSTFGVDSNGNVTIFGPPTQSSSDKMCRVLNFAGIFNGFAAWGAASAASEGPIVIGAAAESPAAPILAGIAGTFFVAGAVCSFLGH